jgi:Tfp pilus assembly PilM family ATPase
MFSRYVAGLSYAGDVLRTAVLRLKKDGPVLCHLSEERVKDRTGTWFLRDVIEPRSGLMKKVDAVSVGVDNASLFYHSFPLDQSLAAADRAELIDWELSHYISDYVGTDFIKDVHVLLPEVGAMTPGLLVVAANRSFVQEIQSTIREQGVKLQVIETNFFGATYALGANYPETGMKRVLAVAIEADRVDVGVLNKGKLERHACAPVTSQGSLIGFIRGAAVSGKVDEVYLSGAGASHALVVAARPQMGVPVEMLNPVRKLRIKRRFEKGNEFAGVEFRFASVIGCALRRQ